MALLCVVVLVATSSGVACLVARYSSSHVSLGPVFATLTASGRIVAYRASYPHGRRALVYAAAYRSTHRKALIARALRAFSYAQRLHPVLFSIC